MLLWIIYNIRCLPSSSQRQEQNSHATNPRSPAGSQSRLITVNHRFCRNNGHTCPPSGPLHDVGIHHRTEHDSGFLFGGESEQIFLQLSEFSPGQSPPPALIFSAFSRACLTRSQGLNAPAIFALLILRDFQMEIHQTPLQPGHRAGAGGEGGGKSSNSVAFTAMGRGTLWRYPKRGCSANFGHREQNRFFQEGNNRLHL